MSNENSYIWGQCTWYAAGVASWVPAGWGDAHSWYDNAQAQGFSVGQTPAPGALVVYNGPGYSDYGHVAIVKSVNGDGSFNVSEMNYQGVGLVDERKSTMQGVQGFVYGPPGTSAPAESARLPIKSGVCQTFQFSIAGNNICMDGITGMMAMVGGGILMLGGIAVIIAVALRNSGAGKEATRAVSYAGGPVGAAVRAHQTREEGKRRAVVQVERQRRDAARQTHVEAIRRSQLRTSRARARAAEAKARAAKGGAPSQRPRVISDPGEAREFLKREGYAS